MKEQTLKIFIFIFLVFGKLFIFMFLYLKSSAGAFSPNEAITASAVIFPLFVVYLTIVLESFFKNPFKSPTDKKTEIRKVKLSVVLATFIFLPLYILGFVFVINRVAHDSEFIESFPKMVALIESFLGIYVGIIIKSLFKEKEIA